MICWMLQPSLITNTTSHRYHRLLLLRRRPSRFFDKHQRCHSPLILSCSIPPHPRTLPPEGNDEVPVSSFDVKAKRLSFPAVPTTTTAIIPPSFPMEATLPPLPALPTHAAHLQSQEIMARPWLLVLKRLFRSPQLIWLRSIWRVCEDCQDLFDIPK